MHSEIGIIGYQGGGEVNCFFVKCWVFVGSGSIDHKRNKTFILFVKPWKYGYLFFAHLRNDFSAIEIFLK